MLRYTSRRFQTRRDYTYPELSTRAPRVTRRIELVSVRSAPRSGVASAGLGAAARR